jgi:hypothetical protein
MYNVHWKDFTGNLKLSFKEMYIINSHIVFQVVIVKTPIDAVFQGRTFFLSNLTFFSIQDKVKDFTCEVKVKHQQLIY